MELSIISDKRKLQDSVLAKWFAELLHEPLTCRNFINAIDNGVTLCKFASMCGRPASEMQVDVQAASGSKEAIQNMVTFNDTMKLLGAPDSLRIPPESLVLHKDDDLVRQNLFGLIRWQTRLPLPRLLQLEDGIIEEPVGPAPPEADEERIRHMIREALTRLGFGAHDLDRPRIHHVHGEHAVYEIASLGRFPLRAIHDFLAVFLPTGEWDLLEHLLYTNGIYAKAASHVVPITSSSSTTTTATATRAVVTGTPTFAKPPSNPAPRAPPSVVSVASSSSRHHHHHHHHQQQQHQHHQRPLVSPAPSSTVSGMLTPYGGSTRSLVHSVKDLTQLASTHDIVTTRVIEQIAVPAPTDSQLVAELRRQLMDEMGQVKAARRTVLELEQLLRDAKRDLALREQELDELRTKYSKLQRDNEGKESAEAVAALRQRIEQLQQALSVRELDHTNLDQLVASLRREREDSDAALRRLRDQLAARERDNDELRREFESSRRHYEVELTKLATSAAAATAALSLSTSREVVVHEQHPQQPQSDDRARRDLQLLQDEHERLKREYNRIELEAQTHKKQLSAWEQKCTEMAAEQTRNMLALKSSSTTTTRAVPSSAGGDDAELEHYRQKCKEQQALLEKRDHTIEEQMARIREQTNRADKAQTSIEALTLQFNTQIAALQRDLDKALQERDAAIAVRSTLEQTLQDLKSSELGKRQTLELRVRELEREVEHLQDHSERARALLETQNAKDVQALRERLAEKDKEIAALQPRQRELEERYRQDVHNLASQHNVKLEEIRQRAQAENDALRRTARDNETNWTTQYNALNIKMQQMAPELERSLAELERVRRELQLSTSDYKGRIGDLEAQIVALREQQGSSDTKVTTVRAEYETTITTLKSEWNAKQSDYERQLAELRAAHDRATQELKDSMQAQLKQSLRELNERLKGQHEKEIADLQTALQGNSQSQVTTTRSEYETKITTLTSEWNAKQADYERQLAELRAAHDRATQELKDSMQAQLKQSLRELNERLKTQHEKEIADLQAALQGSGESQATTLRSRYEARIALLTQEWAAKESEHNRVLAELRAQHDAAVRDLEVQMRAKAELERELRLLRESGSGAGERVAQLMAELAAANTKIAGLEAELASLRAESSTSATLMKKLQRDLDEKVQDLEILQEELTNATSSESQVTTYQSEIMTLRSTIQTKEIEFEKRLQALKESHEKMQEELSASFKVQMKQSLTELKAKLHAQHDEEMKELKSENAALRAKVA